MNFEYLNKSVGLTKCILIIIISLNISSCADSKPTTSTGASTQGASYDSIENGEFKYDVPNAARLASLIRPVTYAYSKGIKEGKQTSADFDFRIILNSEEAKTWTNEWLKAVLVHESVHHYQMRNNLNPYDEAMARACMLKVIKTSYVRDHVESYGVSSCPNEVVSLL